MADDGRHEKVLDNIMDLQARLRGDLIVHHPDRAKSRRGASSEPDAGADPLLDAPDEALPPPPSTDAVSARHADLQIVESAVSTPSADRLAALSDRLRRVERELEQAMERLRTAEERFGEAPAASAGDDDETEPEPEPLSPEREISHRVLRLQDLASRRDPRE